MESLLITFYVVDGSTEEEKAIVDMMLDQVMDLRNGVVRLCYNKDYVGIHFTM